MNGGWIVKPVSRFTSLVAAVVLISLLVGCKKETAPAVGTGKPAPLDRVVSRCPLNRTVSDPDTRILGGAVYMAYRAALDHADPGAFDEFSAAFKKGADRADLERYVWPRVVSHVTKYVAGPDDPSFTLCLIEEKTNDRKKIFVKSNDTGKSDPPVVLVREDGKWLIDVMTP